MDRYGRIMLRLMILVMRRLGYSLPLLRDARPIKTGWWNIYRHYGRLVRLRPMCKTKLAFVKYQQKLMDDRYDHLLKEAKDAYIQKVYTDGGTTPHVEEVSQYMYAWQIDNPRPEYRPCDTCALMKDRVIPCPYYNIVAGSKHHACCTHDYEIIKDVPKQ